MGQYFKLVNLDRHEYVCPWCIGSGAKLWEWAANPQGAVLTLLLRKSDHLGGGDIGCRPIIMNEQAADTPDSLASIIATAMAREGIPSELPDDGIVGRWAENRIVFIGDYDSSELYSETEHFTNISRRLVDEWNQFIELNDLQLTFHDDCSCRC